MRALAVLLWMFTGNATATAQAEVEVEPTGVIKAFFQALQSKDLDRVVALTAPVAENRNGTVRPYYERMAGRSAPSLVAHLQLSRTAVVVFVENPAGVGPVDLDPAYLVRRDGRWLALFKLTRFDRDDFQFTAEEKAEFRRLEVWYEQQKLILKKLLQDKP